eukprot:366248-Chlamydomonas_euryale.AAC.5
MAASGPWAAGAAGCSAVRAAVGRRHPLMWRLCHAAAVPWLCREVAVPYGGCAVKWLCREMASARQWHGCPTPWPQVSSWQPIHQSIILLPAGASAH